MSSSSTNSSNSKKRPLHQKPASFTEPVGASSLCGLCHEPLHRHDPSSNIVVYAPVNVATQSNGTASTCSSKGNNNNAANCNNGNQTQLGCVPRQVSHTDSSISSVTCSTSGSVLCNGHAGSQIEDVRANTIVTCANINMQDGSKRCKSASMENESPYFHFSCIQKVIPPESKLYWDLCQFLDYQEEEKRRKRMKILARDNAKETGNLKFNVNPDGTVKISADFNMDLPVKIPLDRRGSTTDTSSRSNSDSISPFIENQHRINTPSTSSSGRSTPSFHSNSNATKREKPKNPFLCPLCDIRGSATFLSEYFSTFRAMKAEFYQDDEAVDAIMSTGEIRSSYLVGESKENMTKTYSKKGSTMIKDRGFIKYLMSKQQDFDERAPYKKTELTMDHMHRILKSIPRNKNGSNNDSGSTSTFELGNVDVIHLIGQPVHLFCYVSNSYHTGRIIDSRLLDEIDTTRLKPITKKNCMEHIDDESSDRNIMLDKCIGRTQYLVRFRARKEGRKIAVQYWIYLEEHPLMVGLNIAWANVYHELNKNMEQMGVSTNCNTGNLSADVAVVETLQERKRRLKRMKSKFKPVQTFLRSSLEMMHVDCINADVNLDVNADSATSIETSKDGFSIISRSPNPVKPLNVIAHVFNNDFECICIKIVENYLPQSLGACVSIGSSASVKLNSGKTNCAIGPARKPFQSNNPDSKPAADADADKVLEDELTILESSFSNLPIADFHSPPDELMHYLKALKVYDENLVHATACACVEEEEQRRVLEWNR